MEFGIWNTMFDYISKYYDLKFFNNHKIAEKVVFTKSLLFAVELTDNGILETNRFYFAGDTPDSLFVTSFVVHNREKSYRYQSEYIHYIAKDDRGYASRNTPNKKTSLILELEVIDYILTHSDQRLDLMLSHYDKTQKIAFNQ